MKPRIVNGEWIVFQHDNIDQLRTVLPGLKEAGGFAAVPLSLESARILRNLGIEAPSPIRTRYGWPIMAGRKPRPHQVDTSEFFTLNPRAHCHNSMRCVDKETEFLTPAGWKKLPDYQEGDLVAQWNKESDRAEFVAPTEYIKTPCDEMIHFKTTKGIDQMLTPLHRVIYHDPSGNIRERSAEFVHQRNLKNACGWNGKIPVTFRAPEREGINLTAPEIRLMVALMADGSFPTASTSRCVMNIKKERKKERIRELLRNAGVEFHERTRDFPTAKGYTRFYFYAPRREKEFTPFWWGCTEAQLEVIIDEAQHWDGSLRKAGSFEFCTRIRESADFIQYAAVATKRKASLNAQPRQNGKIDYSVFVQPSGAPIGMNRVNSDLGPVSQRVPTEDGFCYCFSVPSTYIIFRRNGRVFISGNTGKTISTLWAIDFLQMHRVINKALIVAPLSTLERAWGDEIFLNFPHKRFVVLHGTKEKRLRLLKEEADLYVVNHDGVEILQKELMLRGDIDLVVIDELAVVRNAKTARFKAMNALVNNRGVYTWCWGLTGTPTSNEPTDAYGQAKLIRPESVKNISFTSFKNATMQQFGPFRWVPRKGSEEIVARVLSPSIRFDRSVVTSMEPCLIERHAELSPEQKHHINKLLREAVTEIDGSTVSAVNAAVLLSKVVQAACISINTPVLSSRGWIPIQEVRLTDKLWDGEEWVAHSGLLDKGEQITIECGGVRLTPDHELLTDSGWESAQEIINGDAGEGFNWAAVRLPDSFAESRIDARAQGYRERQASAVAVSLRLRDGGSSHRVELAQSNSDEPTELRVPSRGVADSRNGEDTSLPNMDTHAQTMHLPRVQRLRELWSQRYHGLREVAKIVRGVLGRYGRRVCSPLDIGAERQRRPILPRELSVGDSAAAVKQQAIKHLYRDAEGAHDRATSGALVGAGTADTAGQNFLARVDCREGAGNRRVAVFDIANCGPRSRFVVRGRDGELRIAHNCGVVYGANGEFLRVDFGPRMKVLEEAIAENNGEKVILFLPFTGALQAVASELKKKWTVEVVDGSVSAGKRNQIYADFQSKKDPHVLVAHPQCMSHGLELTAASLIIFGAPITSNEIYTQACARIDGGGQKSKIDILHISSTPTERKIYATVREKGRLQSVVLDLLKSGLK